MSVSVSAPQWTTTIGLYRRGLNRWTARATSSFPVPLSPSIRTVESTPETVSICSRTLRIASLCPISSLMEWLLP